MLWMLLTAEAAETCERTWTDLEVATLAFEASDAFSRLDSDAFSSTHEALQGAIRCVSEPLSRGTVTAWFQVAALDAFLRRSPEDVARNTTAMAELDPAPPATSIVPRGHPVRLAWDLARTQPPSERLTLPVPEGGRLRVDGQDRLERPADRDTVLQFVELGGSLAWTELLHPGQPTPTYPVAPESAREAYETSIVFDRRRRPIELPIIAGALVAGSVGTWLASTRTQRQFEDAEGKDLRSIRATHNALVITSTTMGAAGLGLGVWGAVAW